MKIEKYHLNLAGEYRVAAELLKRGLFATVTLGNMKGADVIAVGQSRRAAVIEVKASNSTRFVTGFNQKYKTPEVEHPTFWVLYSCQSNGDAYVERFFVLTHAELSRCQARRNTGDASTPYLACASRFATGVDNVRADDVEAFEGQWAKIVEWCA